MCYKAENKVIGTHRLSRYVDTNSDTITDAELNEIESLIPFDEYVDDYEYSGNFVFSKNEADVEERVMNMCCGIIQKDIQLASGEIVYFAFDYGH